MGDVERPPLDWSLCCLCRVTTSEELSQPWRGRGRGASEHHDEQQGEAAAGYRSFETNILKFQELGSVPLNVCPAELNDGSGIANTLQSKQAKWHGSCRKLFEDNKLARQEKRCAFKAEKESEGKLCSPLKKKLRASTGSIPDDASSELNEQHVCFFCDMLLCHLRNVLYDYRYAL